MTQFRVHGHADLVGPFVMTVEAASPDKARDEVRRECARQRVGSIRIDKVKVNRNAD